MNYKANKFIAILIVISILVLSATVPSVDYVNVYKN